MLELMEWMNERPLLKRIIISVNKYVTVLVYVMYPIGGLYLLYLKDSKILLYILKPGISFVLVSLVRKAIDAPRPYEVYAYQPILSKDTKGESFPSRHVFSIFVIGRAFYWLNPVIGSVFLVLGIILALCRVLGGVHFPRDVIAGALIAVIVWAPF